MHESNRLIRKLRLCNPRWQGVRCLLMQGLFSGHVTWIVSVQWATRRTDFFEDPLLIYGTPACTAPPPGSSNSVGWLSTYTGRESLRIVRFCLTRDSNDISRSWVFPRFPESAVWPRVKDIDNNLTFRRESPLRLWTAFRKFASRCIISIQVDLMQSSTRSSGKKYSPTFLPHDEDRIENDWSNNCFAFACVSVAVVTFLKSHYPPARRRNTGTQTNGKQLWTSPFRWAQR
jgi:hypothetical protein